MTPTTDSGAVAPADHVSTWTDDRWAELYASLRELKETCGPNKHDQVMVLVSVCIGHGIDTLGYLIKVLAKLGLNGGHIAIIVKEGIGRWWQQGAEGKLIPLSC